jgi:hypothetical protein
VLAFFEFLYVVDLCPFCNNVLLDSVLTFMQTPDLETDSDSIETLSEDEFSPYQEWFRKKHLFSKYYNMLSYAGTNINHPLAFASL